MGPVVHLRSAVCLLGRFPALTGIDLEMGEGQVVLVRGANGAGKSTLLRLLAGLVPLTSGEAVVLGHDLRQDRRALRRHIGFLGHATGLYDDLTVADNLRFWGKASGSRPAAVELAMARMGLEGRLAGVAAGRLSEGQRRRAAIAGLLARGAGLWLLDEPHAGLDAEGRDVLDAVVAEAAAGGTTVLLASHELDRAGPLAHRCVTIAGGSIVADEPSPGAPASEGSPADGAREPEHVA